MTGRDPQPPNLQNIPIRTPEGRRIREAFTVPSVRLKIDFTRIEMWILSKMGKR